MLNLAFLANAKKNKFPKITALTFDSRDQELITGCENGEIYVWNSDQYEYSHSDIKLRILPSVIQKLSKVRNLKVIDKSVLHFIV